MEINKTGRDSSPRQRGAILAAGGVIVLAALAAYHNGLSGPFIFDDIPSIKDNATILHLWPLGPVLSPHQGGMTTSGRPLLNLSFAVNRAISGVSVWGYHATNLAIHVLAGLALFGVARRTLEKMPATRSGTASTLLGLGIALIWTVHPLLTEAVSYTVQRAESLMGLFYLLTMYCFIRYADETGGGRVEAGGGRRWALLSIGACLLGMATKEVMVSAPVIVLLYDRTFMAGSFREALRRRWRCYLGLAATWAMLAYCVLSTENRGGTAGLDTHVDVTPLGYWLTQFPAVLRYLELAVWPDPLALDYGTEVAHTFGEVWPGALIVIGLLAATAYALSRPAQRGGSGQALGFAGAWFFAVLAPTSLVPIVVQIMAEHRMYLAMAPVVAVGVLAAYHLFERLLGRGGAGRAVLCCFCLCLVVASGYGFMTFQRNEDYRSDVGIWSATVAAYPTNARAHHNLGVAYRDARNYPAAIAQWRAAIRLKPEYPEAINNLGGVLFETGRTAEAIARYQEALDLKPDFFEARCNLGNALAASGRQTEALVQFEEALRLKPDDTGVHASLARAYATMAEALMKMDRGPEAIDRYLEAARLAPADADIQNNLGMALAGAGRLPEAITHYKEALRLDSSLGETHNNLGIALAESGRSAEAIAEFQEAVRFSPGLCAAHNDLAIALGNAGRLAEARVQFEEALRIDPTNAEVKANLERLRARQ